MAKAKRNGKAKAATPRRPAFPRTAAAWWARLPVYGPGQTRFVLLMAASGSCGSADAMRERSYEGLSRWAKLTVKRAYYAARQANQQSRRAAPVV